MSEYQEFTGKNVEEALRNARQSFGVTGLDDLDFEILTPGSRGVLGMGAEQARIVAAPRAALGGAAPKREAAASVPLSPSELPEREGAPGRERFGDRERRGPRPDAGRRFESGGRPQRGDVREGARAPGAAAVGDAPFGQVRDPGLSVGAPSGERGARDVPAARPAPAHAPRRDQEPRRRAPDDRAPRRDAAVGEVGPGRPDRGERADRPRPARSPILSDRERDEVITARASLSTEREEIQAAEASPEALAAGREILEEILKLMDYHVSVTVREGETSKLDVTAEGDRESLGALIGRKGERLSALQHLVNLMLSRRMGAWTRVLVDVEDYRGRRERQLQEIALRAAERVIETGKMLQLEPMPALERRWIHLALRGHAGVATQSIGEEPERRVVVLRREV